MKVAIVHYWWLSNRGGEAVVSALLELFPDADLYVHVCDEALVRATLGPGFKGQIFTSLISRLPGARRHYQKYLPLMPLALEQWDLTAYDLIISSESGPAKGIVTRPDALHICYCHSPMRYLWDMYHEYLGKAAIPIRLLFPILAHWLRVWDRASADRVDAFVANSNFIASRIRKYYRRESEVIFPPVNTSEFVADRPRGDYYLCLGQLVAYKRSDLAVDAFNRLNLPLVIIGEGELYAELKARAAPNIRFLGRQPFSVVKEHLECCKGLIFPGMEDFGIVPVEAMAAGAPVIAYGRGGVLDTVIDGKTGILFHEQTLDALIEAVQKVESGNVQFDPSKLRAHSLRFDKIVFKQNMRDLINSQL
ncbi:glycosyltransferase [Noviherbaspirillum sedimenti]|uniref:Glycosyltransferase family 4 protein n=1 Tax=Noviherbaspirillum sedimenti TaxID=2320865 RepID=A0A3A3GIC8_9BURK|nr:glycosyltransferase [Noviherbaspirillum sedimenti]RJG02036.1 glycosyltransferase family 4 protein [Noviherbaspirillum sedimenti]